MTPPPESASPPATDPTVTLPATPGPSATTPAVAGPPSSADAPPLPDLPGYEILDVLGHGGMGVVYRARQLALNRLVAVKMIRSGAFAGERELARFRLEAEATARLQHPNVVQIHEVGIHRGQPYLCLELVEGPNLERRLGAAPLPARDAAALVEVLARAAHAAHDRGIIHRDLKPANVLLTPGGTPKLSDFGLARVLEGASSSAPLATEPGSVQGTPAYMAPEQAGGVTRQVGVAADVYALGAILYRALTGRPPFVAPSSVETVMKVLTQDPPPPRGLVPSVPRDLETICLKCLAKAPRQRYATALDLADDLRRFLAHEPIRARRTGPAGRALRWARRHPARTVAASLALLALFLALAVGWYRHRVRADALAARLGEVDRIVALAERQQPYAGARQRYVEELLDQGEQLLAGLPAGEAGDADATRVRRARARLQLACVDVELRLNRSARALARAHEAAELLDGIGGDGPDVLADRARARGKLAQVLRIQGDLAGAAARAVEMERLAERIPAEHPECQRLRGVAAHLLSAIAFDRGETAAALAHARRARALREPLAAAATAAAQAAPGTLPADRRDLADTLFLAGLLAYAAGDPRLSADLMGRSLSTLERLVRDDPDNDDWKRALAEARLLHGLAAQGRGDAPAARAHYRASLDLAERHVPLYPRDAWWARQRLESRLALAGLLDELRDARAGFERCLAALGELGPLIDALAAEDPENLELRERGLRVAITTGACLAGLAALDPSDAAWDRARAAYESALAPAAALERRDPANVTWRINRLGIEREGIHAIDLARGVVDEQVEPEPAEVLFIDNAALVLLRRRAVATAAGRRAADAARTGDVPPEPLALLHREHALALLKIPSAGARQAAAQALRRGLDALGDGPLAPSAARLRDELLAAQRDLDRRP